MNVEHICPFIESTSEVFTVMLNCELKRGKMSLREHSTNSRHLTGFIGLKGEVSGRVAMTFPPDTAIKIVNKLLNIQVEAVDSDVCDAIGEIMNMVAGGAKAKLCDPNRRPIDMTLPTVVRGKHFDVENPLCSSWLHVSFDSLFGPFTLRMAIEPPAGDSSHQGRDTNERCSV